MQPPPADLRDLPADPPASDAAPAADNSPTEKEKPSAGDKPKAKLEPIPDPQQVGPTELEATSFHGVTPGVTTIEQMQKAAGAPKEIHKQGKTMMQLHSIEPFHRVEASCTDGKVTSIIIRFEKAFPASIVAKQLDWTKVQPVFIANEMGEILGEAYPERGGVSLLAERHARQAVAESEPDHPRGPQRRALCAAGGDDPRHAADLSLHDLDQALQLQAGNARARWLAAACWPSLGEYSKAMV